MNWFVSKIINRYKDENGEITPQNRASIGSFAGVIGIVTNTLISFVKISLGIIFGSLSTLADGINNLMDAGSSIITMVGFALSKKPSDEEHPFGHARIEYISGIVSSIIIVVMGFEMLRSSITKIIHPESSQISSLLIITLVISIAVKLLQWWFYSAIGKTINSISIKATATDSRNDCLATASVILGLLIEVGTGCLVDGYFGAGLSLFIIWSGIQLIKETSSPLLGEAPDPDLVKSIKQIVNSFDGVLGTHDLILHNYGTALTFASIHVEVDSESNLLESHDLIDRIESYVNSHLNIELTAHLDPIVLDNPIRNEIFGKLKTFIDSTEGLCDLHDLRIVPTENHTNVIFDVVVENDCKMSIEELHNILQDFIWTINPSHMAVINFDRNYSNV